ncbi:beta-ketoacyl synthase N-terminal-like domain-containing protein [Marinactinospora rubrisoli]|uniref:Beta-ketoacyl synthase N-terminal-like domain-containing protein n=1 Tax=Marinactinospora rubrisoli TaxID=2715399 RepID=A0ABW2KNA6_9ACTN
MTAAVLDIVGCGVLSPAGSGLDPLAAALAAPDASAGSLPSGPDAPDGPGGEPFPPMPVRPVTDFRPQERLGRKGLSRLTRSDQLAMAVCGTALTDLTATAGPLDDEARGRTGIVLGTGAGSVRRLAEFTRDTFVQDRPYMVNPSHFPGTLMNSPAGQSAIRYGLTGVNSTLSGGPVAGLSALRFARNALLAGHADRLLAGGVEELSAQSAWAWYRTGALGPGVALGEGSAVFVLERGGAARRNRAPLGHLLACELRFADPSQGAAAVGRRLTECVQDALAVAAVSAADVAVVVPGAAGRRGWSAAEEQALRRVFGAEGPRRLTAQSVLGETHSAGAALHLAALLAWWRDGAATDGAGVGVVTALGPDGQVGCLIVRRATDAEPGD